ncbi:MAG: hypothetical protein AABZ84_02520 [Pseudomonadota bacterium]
MGVVAALAALQGCATYSDGIGRMDALIAAGQPADALKSLGEQSSSRQDEVLYLLNKAVLLHQAGDYPGSNAALEQAKPLMEKYAVLSVSEQAGALAVNDILRAYGGAHYERIYAHIFAALNYLALGKLDDTRVEVLQMDDALTQIPKDTPAPSGFARYLSGLIFESLGEWDDAMIAYRGAYEAYRAYPAGYSVPPPESLQRDLLRVAAHQDLNDELIRYRQVFAVKENDSGDDLRGKGEVVLILESGLAPLKREIITGVYAADGRLVTVALPYYQSRVPTVTRATLSATGGPAADGELVEDVERMALAELEREMPAIVARAVGRAVVKNKTIKQSERQGNDALGLLVNVAGLLTERADTRSWSTLPSRMYIARLPLAPGRYRLTLEARDAAGVMVGVREYNDIIVNSGTKRFIVEHWVVPADVVPRPLAHQPAVIDQRRRN